MVRFCRRQVLRCSATLAAALFGFAHAPLPASANQIVPRSTAPQAMRSVSRVHAALAATTPTVYVCDFTGSVRAYDATILPGQSLPQATATPAEIITGLRGPTSLAVDAVGNLYVVEALANDVKIFAPESQIAFKTLTGIAGTQASQIALDGNANVYVATNANQIAVYRNGATTPSATLTDRSIASITSIAADRIGNIFISYIPQAGGASAVGAFPATISEGTGLFVPLPELNGTGTPFQMTVDTAGDLLVGDASRDLSAGGHLTMYRPANPTPAGTFPFDLNEVRERFALSGPASGTIFFAETFGVIAMRSLTSVPAGMLEFQFVLPRTFTTSSIAAYPPAPLGIW